jgi:hypothetical protein
MRFGIMNYGPLDVESPVAPKQINVGIVGTTESIDGVRHWLERCKSEITAKPNKEDANKPNKQPNLFAQFPGFNQDTGFYSNLVLQDTLCRPLLKQELPGITSRADRNERIRIAVDLLMEEIRYLSQNTSAPVIICAVPLALLEAMGPEENNGVPDEENDDGDPGLQLDFHDMLKAGAMQQYRKPIQLILPSTYDPSKQRQQHKLKLGRELQDEATRAWNIHTALYYKAGGVPWRLPRPSTELTVCYVGVSFYRSLDKQSLLTSVAQVFNERGEGVVVRGGTATISKDDRQAHLPKEHAYELLKNALASYRETHHTFPARIVIHKSSRFDNDEQEGFTAALSERVGAVNWALILSPKRIIFGGGVLQQPCLLPLIRPAFVEELNGYIQSAIFEHIDTYLVPAELPQTSGILGALVLGKTRSHPVDARSVRL